MMEAFLAAFGLIFLMEMGDRSQLVVMALATRYSWRQVVAGVILAAAVTHGLAVLEGGAVCTFIPLAYVKTLAALLFLGFAGWTLCGEGEDEEEQENGRWSKWPVMAIAATFFISEFGDKTQLATIAAVAKTGQPGLTWLGAVAGMVVADILGIGIGQLLRQVPVWIVKGVSSAVFTIFGWLTLAEAWDWPAVWWRSHRAGAAALLVRSAPL